MWISSALYEKCIKSLNKVLSFGHKEPVAQ